MTNKQMDEGIELEQDIFDEDMEEDNIIELFDDEGNATKLEHILTFELNDMFYVAFLPLEEPDEEENEVIFMRLDEDESGADVFYTIDSEEELENVWQTFLKIYEEIEEDEE